MRTVYAQGMDARATCRMQQQPSRHEGDSHDYRPAVRAELHGLDLMGGPD